MRKKQLLAGFALAVISSAFVPVLSTAQETCGAAVAACRNALFVTEDIIAADDACALAVLADSSDGCARIFRAATRILRVVGENSDGADPTSFTDSVKEMLDQFGISPTGRDLYALAPVLPRDLNGDVALPSDSPEGPDVQEALDLLFVFAIRDSVADLRAVPTDTIIRLSAAEQLTVLSAIGTNAASPSEIELDYGESKLFESVLLIWQSQLQLMNALDLNIDIDAFTPIQDQILIQQDVLDAHPNLLVLLPVASVMLSEANQANRDAIAAYLAASVFIRSEIDDQTDDLLTIEPDELADEAEVRTQLATLFASLDGPTPILNTGTSLFDEAAVRESIDAELGTNLGDLGAVLDLGLFYDSALIDVRDVLPAFDADNSVVDGSFPDPTFGGVLVSDLDPPAAAPAGTIDDFEVGNFSLLNPAGNPFGDDDTQSGLSPNNVLAGERFVLVDPINTVNPGSATADLALTAGDDAVVFSAEGESPNQLGTRLEIFYLFDPPLDLAMMGSAFSIELVSLADSAGASSILVGVQGSAPEFGESDVEIFSLNPGIITVPFGTLVGNANLSQVRAIGFQFRSGLGAIGSVSVSIDDFRIVPEPGTALPFGVGLMALLGIRRKQRSK